MRYFMLLTLTVLPFLIGSIDTTTSRAQAQTNNATLETKIREIEALSRAKNLARQAAEAANGGLENYRSDFSMHGSAAKSPYVDQGDYWVFTFKGGIPAYTVPTVESEVRVNKADFETTVIYNGTIRQ